MMKNLRYLFVAMLMSVSVGFLGGCVKPDGNRPPSVPSVICPSEAEVNEEVTITVRSVDPDRDELVYRIRFGDGGETWSDYYPSSEKVSFKHKYKEALSYGVKVRAFDRKVVSEWSEEKWIKVKASPQRKMAILWMGDGNWARLMEGVSDSVVKSFYKDIVETWSNGYGGTHIVGFHEPFRPSWLEGTEVKLISYLKNYTLEELQAYAERWKSHPNNGGYWLISGHEPDITGGDMNIPGSVEAHKALRRTEYKAIRAGDPDAWNHPVVTFYNMTGAFNGYPGWQNAFVGDDHDVFIIDCYPGRYDGTIDYEGMEAGYKLVQIGLERSKGQFIPNLDAVYLDGHKRPPVIPQWEWWEGKFPKLRAVCYWNSGIGSRAIGVYEDEELGREAREINRRLGLLN